jgi:sulfofructosephosphate aldolase
VIGLDAIARPSGVFCMVAMDQRESLRAMLRERGRPDDDATVVAFKLAVARELGPLASGFLVEHGAAFDEIVRAQMLPPECGLLLAADALVQERGGPVEDTALDPVDPAQAAGLKLLVIWRDDAERPRRLELARTFVETARAAGVLSVLEGIVRGPHGFDRDAAIVEAAQELASVGPSLYKVEVPAHGKDSSEALEAACREIERVVEVPWVVLSNGVDADDFPAAVAAACRAGASGFLAGRALWTSVLAADDPTPLLRERSAVRLRELVEIVEREGRPWR